MTLLQAVPYVVSISLCTVGLLHAIIVFFDVQDPAEVRIKRSK